MKHIIKQMPPPEFVTYCGRPRVTFKKLNKNKTVKNVLKTSLLQEQGYICCYCGSRIQLDEFSCIEHIKPKANPIYKHLELDYNNLLCSCIGGRLDGKKKDGHPRFCDANKECNILPIDPLQAGCGDKFIFDDVGNIYDDGTQESIDTIKTLHLNNSVLKNRRLGAINGIEMKYNGINPNWKQIYDDLDNKANDKYELFVFVLQQYIKIYKLISNSQL